MSGVTLKINGEKDFATNHPLITFGRTMDNSVPLDDTNVSRYHARIEQREDGYWLIDQGSSNGTTVNGNPVETEMLLEDGDVIVFGGTSEILFNPEKAKNDEESGAEDSGESGSAPNAETGEEKSGKDSSSSSLMMIAGVVVGLAVITVVVAGIVIWSSAGGKCEATAKIKGPESGDVLSQSTEVVAEIQQKTPCVGEVVFLLDGKEFGRANTEPYKTSLDAQNFSDLSDGRDHKLKVILLDAKGEVIPQISDEIALAFETLATPTPKIEVTQTPIDKPTPKPQGSKLPTVIETQEMFRNLLKTNFPNAPVYKPDQQFLIEVNKKLAEYVSEGYSDRALQYKDIINVAYVQEWNVDVPLGYILAMSRSKFILAKQGGNEGLWQLSNDFISANGFNGMCGTETLSDASQNCAAKSSALYLKNLYLTIFEGDIIFTVAAFGMSPTEASEWKGTLSPDRKDFWKLIKNSKQREEVVRFFAAGIVAENPGKFGLKKDRPISEMYPNLIGN